jgi:hypothetical protein
MKEVWKDVPGYEGMYQASNTGKIKSLTRIVNSSYGSKMRITGKIKKLCQKPNGYVYVGLSKNGETRSYRVHRLIAMAFIENKSNLSDVNHKNGKKNDNRLSNLEWCSPSQNSIHAYEMNLRKSPNYWEGKFGALHNLSKAVEMRSKEGIIIKTFASIREAERITGIANQNITKCLKGKRASAGGYRWEYVE